MDSGEVFRDSLKFMILCIHNLLRILRVQVMHDPNIPNNPGIQTDSEVSENVTWRRSGNGVDCDGVIEIAIGLNEDVK